MTAYEIIANNIIKKLEEGVIPWKPTWKLGLPQNYLTRKPYRGINLLLLSGNSYGSPYYLTFKQVSSLGGKVNSGEHGHIISYCTTIKEETEDEEIRKKFFLRYYLVWNIEQTSLKEKNDEQGIIDIPEDESNLKPCSDIVENMPNPPVIMFDFSQPRYNKAKDIIMLPAIKNFDSGEDYFCTLFHELIHSTGHESRLARKSILMHQGYGSESYSQEELIAEIGAFMLCCRGDIQVKIEENTLAYINSWLKVLKSDKSLIFKASGAAQRAVDFISNVKEAA